MPTHNLYGERLSSRGEYFDPVAHQGEAAAHGRIGRVAWGLFERGDGLVLSFDLPGEPLCVIPVDARAGKDGFAEVVAALAEHLVTKAAA